MISRYTRPEMAENWSERRKYQAWLEVELEVCRELAAQKVIPQKDWAELEKKGFALLKAGGVDPEAVAKHEAVTRHDVIAFTSAVADQIGESARYIHFGLTSSDVIDTAFALLMKQAGKQVLSDLGEVIQSCRRRAKEFQALPTIGRSHGMSAEPTSFGLKFLGWMTEGARNYERLEVALKGAAYGKLSGAVGVNAHWSPAFEKKVLGKLGLKREPVATQVVPRDRYADLLHVFALIGSMMERISVELRHLQRSEVSEAMEGFAPGQKGSSAMPHKRNPISAENLTGLARLLRSYSQTGYENIALWHERDISHSSVERITMPDSFTLANYGLKRLKTLIDNLVVREEGVAHNLQRAGGTVFSGHILLSLTQAGAQREEAYYWVQECAHQSLEGQGDFVELAKKHPKISALLSVEKITELGSIDYQLRNVQGIFDEALATLPKNLS